jgi:endoglucanase
MANLALSMMEFRDAYISAEQWDVALRLVKWGTDWLMKAHVKASDTPSENAFVGQVCVCRFWRERMCTLQAASSGGPDAQAWPPTDLVAPCTCLLPRSCLHAQISARPDHWYFGRPELATNPRPVYLADASTGGADLASEYAAAYAAGASLFKGVGQTEYADKLFKHAQQAYAFAKAYPKK